MLDLEKEVFELYKMLDYWKGEAKAKEAKGAEENVRLRKVVNAQFMYAALARVINKHAVRGFDAFRKSARKEDLKKTGTGLAIEVPTETECNAELSPTPTSGAQKIMFSDN